MSDELILEISDLSRGGSGVAREPSGRVIFVPRTAPGDRVRARVVFQKKHFAEAELVEVLTPSALRQTPRCPVFGRCGGCQWQHLPYEFQWKTKLSGLKHTLERVSVRPDVEFEELPAERVWEYRNRIQLRGNGAEIGFYGPRSHDLIAIDRCDIARPELNSRIGDARTKGAELSRPYKIELEVFPDGKVTESWNSAHAAGGFRQVHDEQNGKLQNWVKSSVRSKSLVLDLFGGSGNLAYPLVSEVEQIHCVDITVPQESSHPRVLFHRSPVLKWILLQSRRRATYPGATAIFDPPRSGLADDFAEISKALVKFKVREIIAIGCDPDSWARDVSRWVREGWKIDRLGALDLFPQTPHVEALARLVLDS